MGETVALPADWRPAIGTRVQLLGSHPWAGYTGIVVAHETIDSDPSCVVELDMGGHRAGVLSARHIKMVGRAS